jgi:NAD(P)-dependent dehydrogenase (short-subunit alcohol dehydrogenase family)
MSPAASDMKEHEMSKDRRSLNGKVVAITGGARGIGKATAAALVNKGCRVAIGDLDHELAEQTAAHLGGGTVALPLDVTDRASFEGFLDEA